MAKDTDFKFEEHIPWDSPDMSPKICRKWAWPFLGVKCQYCSTTVKVTNFKFNKRVPWDCQDMTP